VAESEGNLRRLASRVETLVKLVSGAAAALLPLVLPEELVPTQLASVTSASALLALIAFMAASSWEEALGRHRRKVVVVGTVGALLVLGLNLAFVKLLPGIGQPPEDHRVLIGYSVTEEGARMLATAGATDLPVEQQLARVGITAVPNIYGSSYEVVRLAYALAMIASFLAIATYLALGEEDGGRG